MPRANKQINRGFKESTDDLWYSKYKRHNGKVFESKAICKRVSCLGSNFYQQHFISLKGISFLTF
jgi:hypothetical protein